MSQDVKALLDRVCGLIAERIDPQTVDAARRRHADVLAWRETDCLPIRFSVHPPEAADLPRFDWKQQFDDPAKSLYMQLRDTVLPGVCSASDHAHYVRADTGVINCMTVFGAGYVVPEHTKPVVNRYVPKEVLADFEVPADLRPCGVMPRVIEHMEHHRSVLKAHGLSDAIDVTHCDQQGPFDVAAQTRGHEIFTDFYEDPEFAHAMMRKSVQVYVGVTRLCREVSGGPAEGGNAVGVWMDRGGVRMCGDSDILVSPAQFEEFILPYQTQALEQLGGGWLHYCGGVKGFSRPEGLHLHALYTRNPHLRGLNWTTAGDWIGEMRKLAEARVAHIGPLPREQSEPLEAYFRRVLQPYQTRTGLLFDADIRPEERAEAVATWGRVQAAVFGNGK